jgi:hypothetical protein
MEGGTGQMTAWGEILHELYHGYSFGYREICTTYIERRCAMIFSVYLLCTMPLPFVMIRLLTCFVLVSFVKAQFNQRWTWGNVPNAFGQFVTKAHWRPDNDPNTPYKEVMFPSGVIELE